MLKGAKLLAGYVQVFRENAVLAEMTGVPTQALEGDDTYPSS